MLPFDFLVLGSGRFLREHKDQEKQEKMEEANLLILGTSPAAPQKNRLMSFVLFDSFCAVG